MARGRVESVLTGGKIVQWTGGGAGDHIYIDTTQYGPGSQRQCFAVYRYETVTVQWLDSGRFTESGVA